VVVLVERIEEENNMTFVRRNEDGSQRRRRVTIDCQAAIEAGEKNVVEQSHKKEVDINQIVRRAAGNAELIAKVSDMRNWRFDDVPTNDFQEMMNQLIKAKETFYDVPKEIRQKFGNDPAAFMDFVRDEKNSDQLIEWGLKDPPEPPAEPVQVAVVSSSETPPDAA
jgi:phage internal scaffolding protein